MKKQLFAAAAIMAGTMGSILYGADVTVENKTPFKIVKYQIEDAKENLTDYDLEIPAGASKKVSIDNKAEDVTFFFENGMKKSAVFDEMKLVHRFTFTFTNTFYVLVRKRIKRTKYPLGQVKVSMEKEVKSFFICPLGKEDEWKSCSLVNAKKELYAMPDSGKYMIKIETNVKTKPEQIFDNDGKGYDFSKIEYLSFSYQGFDTDTDEEAGDEDEED